MHILITGGTGFIGSALCQRLTSHGHSLTVLSRRAQADRQAVRFISDLAQLSDLNEIDAVINLAGEPIFARRWSTTQKQTLYHSRLHITQQLVDLCLKSKNPPHTFLSASATGYYGNLPDNVKSVSEQGACSHSFSSRLCQAWENCALQAESLKTRVCLLRTGIVLDKQGGALKQILPLYQYGLGGKLGSGKQHWAWISLNDHLRAILFLLNSPTAQGAFNLVSPKPIYQSQFNRLLGETLNRPSLCTVPAWALQAVLGERAELLLDNQPIIPAHLQALGFQFEDPNLSSFLNKTVRSS